MFRKLTSASVLGLLLLASAALSPFACAQQPEFDTDVWDEDDTEIWDLGLDSAGCDPLDSFWQWCPTAAETPDLDDVADPDAMCDSDTVAACEDTEPMCPTTH